MNESTTIKNWLDFLSDVETRLHIAEGILTEKNDQSQDIMHFIELRNAPYLERKKLYDTLPTIRQERRDAKDEIEILTPIVQYIEDTRKNTAYLQQLLGDVRKIERRHYSRTYNNRTNIIFDILGHD